jgi:type II secretory ATPase GspE/PulE/Tfp pilus assembly ATPase PilB-like protein
MIGEVRDAMTAKSLFDTAQTGHLLLSSMHSTSTVSAVTRLASFGVDGSVMNDSLLGIISQTLIRRNCPDCITTRPMSKDEMDYFFSPPKEHDEEYEKFMSMKVTPEIAESTGVVKGNVCPTCEGTKFYGRRPIVEIYIHNGGDEKHAKVMADICNKDPLGPIRMNELFKEGVHEPFALNALRQMFYQITSPQEIMRHLPPSMFTDYRSLLIRKTNEIIESTRGG